MIGSIGAESRYSTGYNNLKPNRNQNKWADTLAQTVDKEDISSRADINRAKKSTVMDSYLALSGKTINTLKQEYSEYESENYRIVPDNEAECFDIYNKDGERLGAFSYSDIKIRQDETTGKQFLISEHGTMSYDALVLDDELKDALQNVMDKDSLDVETLQGFTLNTHSGTGIQYLVKDGEEGRGGKVLLQNEADRKRYEELAEMYFDKYPNLIESREEGFIWADLEIRGMAKRTDQGIISIGADGMSYSDNENYKNNWSVRFSGSMYEKLYEWLQNNKDSMEEIHKFSTWQKVFDEIGGTYERVWSKEELDQGYESGTREIYVTDENGTHKLTKDEELSNLDAAYKKTVDDFVTMETTNQHARGIIGEEMNKISKITTRSTLASAYIEDQKTRGKDEITENLGKKMYGAITSFKEKYTMIQPNREQLLMSIKI